MASSRTEGGFPLIPLSDADEILGTPQVEFTEKLSGLLLF